MSAEEAAEYALSKEVAPDKRLPAGGKRSALSLIPSLRGNVKWRLWSLKACLTAR
jgi:hypothetical protein